MPTLVALLAGFVLGMLVAAVTLGARVKRMRAELVRELTDRVAPVLERRASSLGISMRVSPEVDVGHDGELEVRDHEDPVARMLALADAVSAQEAQLGHVDTIRVAKDDVNAHLGQTTGKRTKS